MDVRVGLWRKLSAKKLMLLNYGVGEDSWVPWTARRSNQSILKEISPECSLEGLMLKLKLQYFGHLMRSANSLEKTLISWKDWGQEEKGTTEDEMVVSHHRLDGHGFGWTPGVGDGQGGLVFYGLRGREELDTTEQLNWTELHSYPGLMFTSHYSSFLLTHIWLFVLKLLGCFSLTTGYESFKFLHSIIQVSFQ